MSDSKDKPVSGAKPNQPGEAKESGRVAFDARGNPVWEWKTATGMFDRNVSTQRLKKLEAKELSLLDTAPVVPRSKGLALEEPAKMPGGGVNPYNSVSPSRLAGHHKPDPNRKSLQTKLHQAQEAQKAPPKQSAWTKFKKNLFGKGGY